MHRIFSLNFILIGLVALSALGNAPPANQDNICAIFEQKPVWYWDALKAQERWHVPISTQMAIIHQESHFSPHARPARLKFLGLIPWKYSTSAYGYSQSVNETWDLYIQDTHPKEANRTSFASATDLIGWYGHSAEREAGISPENAEALYLAYHEGIAGYKQQSYRHKTMLVEAAKKVGEQKERYATQIMFCQTDIPKPHFWNLWLYSFDNQYSKADMNAVYA